MPTDRAMRAARAWIKGDEKLDRVVRDMLADLIDHEAGIPDLLEMVSLSSTEVGQLRREVARLREALEWIADTRPLPDEIGEIAHEALEVGRE